MGPISSERSLVPDALIIAREFRGFTQTELARQSGVTRNQIVNLENGLTRQPSGATLLALCAALDVQLEFLLRRPAPAPPPEVLHFRGKPRVTSRSNAQHLARASIWTSFIEIVQERVERLPENYFRKIDASGTVEDVAARTRKAWGLREDAPVHSAIRLLERAGAFVGTFEGGESGVDAYSWHGRSPHVLCNIDRGMPSRTRHSLLHEAGHLILHRGVVTGDKVTEEQAHQFAGAALLPRRAFWQEFPRSGTHLNWDGMFRMKARWGVSVQAIIRRAYDLTLINAAQYRRAFIHLAQKGWRKQEPGEASEVERPELLPRVIESLARARHAQPSDLSMDLGWPTEVISEMVGTDVATFEIAQRTVVKLKAPKTKVRA